MLINYCSFLDHVPFSLKLFEWYHQPFKPVTNTVELVYKETAGFFVCFARQASKAVAKKLLPFQPKTVLVEIFVANRAWASCYSINIYSGLLL